MTVIKVLPEDIILKIAAGEVIERPASVIKELLENSIDAKATQITVEIADNFLSIEDNGVGMDEHDLKLSYLRHATSKLTTDKDLFNIKSLGFRGEALASISAVSLLEITSKKTNQDNANKVTVHGGEFVALTPAPYPYSSGTKIEVKDLFYNTPARKKYMKTQATENRAIIDVISHYMLVFQDVSFKLINNNKVVFNSPQESSLEKRFYQIHGKDAKNMLDIDTIISTDLEETKQKLMGQNVAVSGLISKPIISRKSRINQILFVNNRLVKSKIAYTAIQNAYKGYLNTGEHAITVLKVTIDPKKIDVNVHPTKQEIKFEDEKLIYRAIYYTILDSLRSSDLTKEIELSKTNFQQTLVKEKVESKPTDSTTRLHSTPQYSTAPKLSTPKSNNSAKSASTEQLILNEDSVPTQTEELLIVEDKTQKYKILGIFDNEFIIVEKEDVLGNKLCLVDFHAAAEITNYEKFKNQFDESSIDTQLLLSPEILDLSLQDSQVLTENLSLFKRLGFYLDAFGETSFQIRSIPTLFGKVLDKKLILELIDQIKNKQETDLIDKIKDKIIIRMACRASEMAGDELTKVQAKQIVDEMFRNKINPYNCPHGRPTIIEFNKTELEKMFKRIR
jgi:DNA mismatch repair protein MutL